jgi:hypothetical protein
MVSAMVRELDEFEHLLKALEALGRRQAQRLRDERRIDSRLHACEKPFVPRKLATAHGDSIPQMPVLPTMTRDLVGGRDYADVSPVRGVILEAASTRCT